MFFLGRSEDVSEEKQEFCRRSRSAAEGFTAAAKNLRGFGCSLYSGLKGDRIWLVIALSDRLQSEEVYSVLAKKN